MYINTYVYVYIYVFIFMYVCVCVRATSIHTAFEQARVKHKTRSCKAYSPHVTKVVSDSEVIGLEEHTVNTWFEVDGIAEAVVAHFSDQTSVIIVK